jgi:hypothetical protein
VIRALLRLIFASPLRAAIICGLLVAVGFGLVSYPDPELRKTLTGWRLEDAFVSGAEQQRVLEALRAAEAGSAEMIRLSETDFKQLGLPFVIGFPLEDDSARRFVIRHVGIRDGSGDPVYVADREVFAAPWWSPHRFIYKAAVAEVRAVGDVIELTFERDVLGLIGLLVFDGLIGALYGLVIGLIVAVVKGVGLPPLPRHEGLPRDRRAPARQSR